MEKVTLRKANAIQGEIRRLIAGKNASETVIVTEFTENVAEVLEKAMDNFAVDVTRKVALNTALFNIRKSVSQANATSGISDLLADIELIDATMAIYSGISTKEVAKSFTEINARIVKIKTAPAETRMYGRCDNVDTSVVEQSTIDIAKDTVKKLKREKQNASDKLLTLNVNTTIDISDVDAMVLKIEGII
jgi:hypothetical protein